MIFHTANVHSKSRRGMAPLEFVLGLPFLMLLFGFTFMLGFVILGQADTAITARHEVWKLRDSSSTWADDFFSVATAVEPDTGRADQVKREDVKIYSWLGGKAETRSRVVVLSGTWDSNQAQLFNKDEPHLSVLDKMLDGPHLGPLSNLLGGKLKVGEATASVFRPLLSLDSLDNMDEIKDADKEKDKQNEKVEAEKKKLEEEIKRIREELAKLIAERDALQAKYDEKAAERDKLQLEQVKLKSEAEKFPEGSKERNDLLSQADALDGPIDTLEAEMTKLSQEIQIKNAEIRVKQKELNAALDAKQKMQEELDKLPS